MGLMNKLLKHIFDLPKNKIARSLSIGMLVILCLVSSCSIRKGIESFFSDGANKSLGFNKASKASLIQKQDLKFNSINCKLLGQGFEDQQVSLKQASSPVALVGLLFFVLPEFLISFLIGFKSPTVLPVPNSWLRWSYLPLFLQNRLLLI